MVVAVVRCVLLARLLEEVDEPLLPCTGVCSAPNDSDESLGPVMVELRRRPVEEEIRPFCCCCEGKLAEREAAVRGRKLGGGGLRAGEGAPWPRRSLGSGSGLGLMLRAAEETLDILDAAAEDAVDEERSRWWKELPECRLERKRRDSV